MREKEDQRRCHASGWSRDGHGAIYEVGKESREGREEEGQVLSQGSKRETWELCVRDVKTDTKTKVRAHVMS